MDIRIDKSSSVRLTVQISTQIVYEISAGKLKVGDKLPSIHALAPRLGVSKGTVGAAYKDLLNRGWLDHTHKRGSRLVVRLPELPQVGNTDLDVIINEAMRRAVEAGYTLRDLRQRVRVRMKMAPPDHVLIVEEEPELRRLLLRELSELLSVPIESVSPEQLDRNPDKMSGALAVLMPGRAREEAMLRTIPRGHPYLLITPSSKDQEMGMVRKLKEASVIAVVSISPIFIDLAIPLLAPHAGGIHELTGRLIDENKTVILPGADLVFCDTAVRTFVKARRVMPYRLVSNKTAKEISDRIAAALD